MTEKVLSRMPLRTLKLEFNGTVYRIATVTGRIMYIRNFGSEDKDEMERLMSEREKLLQYKQALRDEIRNR